MKEREKGGGGGGFRSQILAPSHGLGSGQGSASTEFSKSAWWGGAIPDLNCNFVPDTQFRRTANIGIITLPAFHSHPNRTSQAKSPACCILCARQRHVVIGLIEAPHQSQCCHCSVAVWTRNDKLQKTYSQPPKRQPAPYPQGEIIHRCNNRHVVRHGDAITEYTTCPNGMPTKV
jgi:hypothetical protein